MRNIFRLCIGLLLTARTVAQVGYDTVAHRPVGPGMWHTRIVNSSVPWNINVLTVDLKNQYMSIETAKSNDRLGATGQGSFERTSSMARRKSRPGHLVVAAVNGDFYDTGTGVPINIQIVNGEILRNPGSPPLKSTLGFDVNSRPMLNTVTLSAKLILANTVRTIAGVNTARGENQLVLYNRYKGTTTGTNEYGTEVLIRPLGSWLANDTLRCVADSIVQGKPGIPIPAGLGVLSAHGSSKALLDTSVRQRDTLKLWLGISPAPAKLKELVSGYPKIVFNGQNHVQQGYTQEGGPSHAFQREPRTAGGFSADSSTLYLITVDGRRAGLSVGMTLDELAEFMIKIGVRHGLNLDGGGSTTMVLRDAIMNVPSDGNERAVANALLIVSSAPTDTLSSVLLSPRSLRIFRGESVQLTFTGYDKYFNPIPLEASRVRYRISARLGTVDAIGRIVAASRSDSGYVYAEYDAMRDSARVVIKDVGRITLAPKSVVTDTSRRVTFQVESYDIDNIRKSLPPESFQWRVTNPSIGTTDLNGIFKGKSPGSTKVVASYLQFADTANVTVELATGTRLLDSLETLVGWRVSGQNIDTMATSVSLSEETKTLGERSFRLDYAFTYDPSKLSYAYLDTDIPVYGVPDSIIIDARSDSASHRLFYVVTDNDGELFRIYSNKFANRVGTFDTIRAPLSTPVPIGSGGDFQYPLRIKRIEIQLGSSRQAGMVYLGSVFLDNLRVSYPKITTRVDAEGTHPPTSFRLFQGYPNPFNSSMVIRFVLGSPARLDLRLYDVLGRECRTFFSGDAQAGEHMVYLKGDGLASGVYYVRSTLDPFQLLKVVLVK